MMTTTTETETKPKSRAQRTTEAHYVDNKKFLEALIEFKQQVDDAKANGLEKPIVSNYLGECFLKIATHLSYKANFINYTYRDDMISDGIENCLVAVDKFDPSKSSNPFAYYTQIIYFAFVRRIQKEKKQQATKYKMLENIDFEQLLAHSDGNEEYVNQLIDLMQKQMDTVDPERKEIKTKKKVKNEQDQSS
jgi:DNA-directed RNA polymerase specialized sigma subunit